MIELKDNNAIDKMRESGRISGSVLAALGRFLEPGMTTKQLDQKAEELIRKMGAEPAFKGYKGYPATICASVNDEVVHGIPGDRVLNNGDVIGIDIGSLFEGYYGDTAATFAVGDVDGDTWKLVVTTKESLEAGIKMALAGSYLGAIGAAVQKVAEDRGYSVVREFVGHGIGRRLHEEPSVPNFGTKDSGMEIVPGLAIAIEPMINAGGAEIVVDSDGWTARTRDGSISAHFEHSIIVTDHGPEVLTLAGSS